MSLNDVTALILSIIDYALIPGLLSVRACAAYLFLRSCCCISFVLFRIHCRRGRRKEEVKKTSLLLLERLESVYMSSILASWLMCCSLLFVISIFSADFPEFPLEFR